MSTYNIPKVYQSAIEFQVRLDGVNYLLSVWWNIYSQRSYISLTDQYGTRIVTMPLVGSSVTTGAKPVNLMAGYFDKSVMYYYPTDQVIEVLP